MLSPFQSQIELSFIYGSIARGEELSKSDIDLFIIGNLKISDLATTLKRSENQLQRPINPTIYQKNEFLKNINNKNHFIENVINNTKIFLTGNENELTKLIK